MALLKLKYGLSIVIYGTKWTWGATFLWSRAELGENLKPLVEGQANRRKEDDTSSSVSVNKVRAACFVTRVQLVDSVVCACFSKDQKGHVSSRNS